MEGIFDNKDYIEREQMYDMALQAGLPIVSKEVCAIICAMLVVWGNAEQFTHNHRLVCELRYAQKKYHILGGETPDPTFIPQFQYYIDYLARVAKNEDKVPDYIDDMFNKRYGFHFNK